MLRKATALVKSTRLWGLIGTAVVMYILTFVVFGRVDVGGVMPDTNRMARTLLAVWPKMPFFAQQEKTDQGEAVYYTVSTHQFTREELQRLGATNAASGTARATSRR